MPFVCSHAAAVAVAGVVLSHLCHLISVIVLYHLVECVGTMEKRRDAAFAAACLHIISPAGIFLSAPYAESLFGLLNMSGMLLYCKSKSKSQSSDLYIITSGLCFGIAATVRSNGVFSGAILAYDLLLTLRSFFALGDQRDAQRASSLVSAGLLTGCGTVLPQYLAYREYCRPDKLRPWCHRTIPSIYTWVQSQYW